MNPRLEKLRERAPVEGPRIALVSLYDVENNAVRLLAALLRRAGHHVVELYFKDWISNHLLPPTDRELESFLRVLRRERVNLVALSIRASAYLNVARILTEQAWSGMDLPVLWGGMHPTLEPEACIQEADLLVRGEGDEAFVGLADRLQRGQSLEDIRNLWLRTGQGDQDVRRNPLRELVCDLDSLPFRDYHSHQHKYFVYGRSYQQGDPMHGDPVFQMMASRGCIYRCAYCYNSTYKKQIYKGQRWYRWRSVDSTLEEIKRARQHWDFKRIRFDDEVFILQKAWFQEFCERYPREVGLPFEIFLEPKLATEGRLTALKRAGLAGVYMGVQASERVTGDLYDRQVDNSKVAEIAQLYHRLGIYPHYQLIFDDPVATEGDKRALFELVASFPRPFDLYLFSMTVFPGSELNQKLIDSGQISPYDVEGENTRTFYQHRVNLEYPRPVEDTFWISLIQLLSKSFIPVGAVRPLTRSRFLRRHPWPLIQVAHSTNYVKMGGTALRMLAQGEMTSTLLRRWLNFTRVITT